MDDYKPSTLLRFLLPKAPALAKQALWHSIWLSPTSSKWDLKTELAVKLLREFMNPQVPLPISKFQALTLKDPGIRGKMWISKVTLPAPEEDDIRIVLIKAIEDLKEGGEKFHIPGLAPVEVEWTGHRANVDSQRLRPDLSEAQHYESLMSEVSSNVTILYFHGGAFFLCDPATHRKPVAKLAGLTRGRCLSVRYRLSPQHPFPAALLDAFLAYVSLLSPTEESFHSAIPASHIIFAGDSAGASLALCLLQLLIHLQRTLPVPTIGFNNREVPIQLPAGVATLSGWTDTTRCLPSWNHNAQFDYLPPPLTRDVIARFPKCDLWPTDPLRGDLYCDTSMMCHPLVSPLAAMDWHESCPIWFSYGQEMLLDEGKALAARMAKQRVAVAWEEWEAMPHCFAQLFEWLPAGKKCFAQLADFCGKAVRGSIESKGTWYEAKTGQERSVVVEKLSVWEDEEILQRMRRARDDREGMIDVIGRTSPKL